MSTRTGLDRRTLLRGMLGGAGVAMGLPVLEAMLNDHGTALASGPALPDRFGVWFWGNGVKPDRWIPETTGFDYTLSEELAPLAPVKPWLSVITGTQVRTATHPHHSGMTGILTGHQYHQLGVVRDTIATTFARQSIDQLVADMWQGQAPFRSIEVGITRWRGSDEGSTFQHVSHNGPNDPNPSEYSARTLWTRLFGGSENAEVDFARRSVLDAVRGDIGDLSRRLGAKDRQRLDRHLTSVRELEVRLEGGLGQCEAGKPAEDVVDDTQEPIEEKNQLMSELLALALACDLTRVFTVQFSAAGAQLVVWQVGATDSLHYTSHTESSPQPLVHAATVFTMAQLNTFLTQLRDTPEGDGNLLDRCSILCTSDLCDGLLHSNTEYPVLIAGGGNGRLRPGQHVRLPGANASDAVLTAVEGAGSGLTTFGEGAGYADTPISDLLA
ncbi:MAG: DUF1552 domain-containing protein [Myxococcales bacterium]|nr:DUF1552 domain-containing protein [Myxococcales bacterium]